MTNSKNTKRALFTSVVAILLCCTMLLGTTFAWFTDTAVSEGNRIQAGTLDIDLLMYDEDVNNYVSIADGNGDIFSATATNANNSTNTLWEPGKTQVVYLAIENKGNLDAKYIVELDVTNPEDGKDLYKAMQYAIVPDAAPGSVTAWNAADAKNITSATKCLATDTEVVIDAASTHYFALAVHMKEEAGNEFQGGAVEFDIVVQATQAASENDSFGNDYDENANFGPTAKVDELSDEDKEIVAINGMNGSARIPYTLNVGYQFNEPENIDEVQDSPYKNWHADFVVKADKDVPANSVALAGYYEAWCKLIDDEEKVWVALTSEDLIPANTEIRLVHSMGGGNISVNYEELCRYSYDEDATTGEYVMNDGFQCGAINLATDGSNNGTTLTVELRLYETKDASETEENTTNEETGKYITVGTFKHTF